ncbi:relaxase domain-containing protein [Cupriavidus gilardii]|uniref:relaxase domain-containing protein n=1 Tax=Cupriavidus gilardii TaxID=82541 RepID=UPI001EE58918|nr:relaxase domain-containing protein [Cupriavidus gilardii]MCG5258580.1 relaxase domain-containing protein [Cupriavidus gilardii]
MTQRADGAWRALLNEDLFHAKKAIDSVYQVEVARELMVLGYRSLASMAGVSSPSRAALLCGVSAAISACTSLLPIQRWIRIRIKKSCCVDRTPP